MYEYHYDDEANQICIYSIQSFVPSSAGIYFSSTLKPMTFKFMGEWSDLCKSRRY